MKNKYILQFFLTLIYFNYASSQEIKNKFYGKIVYEQIQSGFDAKKTTLFIKNNKSIYLFSDKKQGVSKQEDGTISFYANKKNTPNFYILNLFTKNEFYTRLFLEDKEYIIKDDSLNLNWEILKETKKIGKYNCQKAKVKYENKIYYAWFTTKLPLPYGPLKFFGLNGLILEIYEENYALIVSAKKIIINDKIISEEVSNIFNSYEIKNKNYISINDYNKILKNRIKKLENIINSRRKKGQKIIKFKKDCEDCNN